MSPFIFIPNGKEVKLLTPPFSAEVTSKKLCDKIQYFLNLRRVLPILKLTHRNSAWKGKLLILLLATYYSYPTSHYHFYLSCNFNGSFFYFFYVRSNFIVSQCNCHSAIDTRYRLSENSNIRSWKTQCFF